MKFLFENWSKFLNEEIGSPTDVLQKWNHKDAAEYAQKLIDDYGEPDEYTESQLTWYDISQFNDTTVKDESVPHEFPKMHRDFVYSTMEIEVPEDMVPVFARATESILIDRLKNTVTARCGDIYANAITLGFVQDVLSGDAPQDPDEAKKEYAKRITNSELPDWFEEKVEEAKKKKKKDACYHKVKARYDVWPSAYASGALVKCRKVGAANWGKSSKKENLELTETTDETTIEEEGLRDWFGKSKSKGGKPGWVQVVSGEPCARQPGQKTTPKCVSSAKRASMTKKERESSQRRKRKADPNQSKKSGAAKPTYVSTDKDKKKKSTKKESMDMKLTKEELKMIIKEELEFFLYETVEEEYYEVDAISENDEYCPVCADTLEEKKKKPCKPSKGKRFAKRVDGKCRSFGQAGQAKSGGDRIRPGTAKGDAYCARSAKIKKCKNPPCANTLSRKKWKCRGSKSVA